CLAVITVLALLACQEKTMTAEKLIARCADAMGGQDNIENIKTLRIGAVYPDHGNHALFIEIKRPNLSYNPQSKIVFDGKRLCWTKGTDGNSAPELVDAEEWKDGEVEIGFYFPAFFDYPSEYLGMETVDVKKFYKLSVKLPLGAEMVYYVDAKTYLLHKAVAHLTLYGEARHPERVFSDYKEIGGIRFPHGFTYGSRNGIMKGRIESVEINAPMDDDHFQIPDGF
ncbi:MAG: hypothetical protein ABIL68_07070, partial [bacterium]